MFLVGVVCIIAIFSELFLTLNWLGKAVAIQRLTLGIKHKCHFKLSTPASSDGGQFCGKCL